MENNGGQIDILCSKEHKTVKYLQTVQAKYITVVQQSSHTVRDEKTLWTLIRLLLEEHSDQGSQHLPLLSKIFWKITICLFFVFVEIINQQLHALYNGFILLILIPHPLVTAPGEELSIWHVTRTVPVNYSDSEVNCVDQDQTAD